MQQICIFGDSIAWGANDNEKGGWVNRLQSRLLKLNGKRRDCTVYNLGVPGDTTEDVLKRFDRECIAREPDVIVFAIGINDSSYLKSKKRNRVPLAKFERNIPTLIKKARRFAKRIVFVGLTFVNEKKTTPIPWRKDVLYFNQAIGIYDKKIRDICAKSGTPFISLSGVLKIGDLSDGLHPDSRGHEKIFRKVYSFLANKNWGKLTHHARRL